MSSQGDGPKKAAELRWRAEEIVLGKGARLEEIPKALSPRDMRQTLHELRVYQIELEMQNEELRRVQIGLDVARAHYFDLYDLAPVGYCILSLEGLILEINLTAVTLLGASRASLIKQPITRFIFKEDQDSYYRQRKRFLEEGEPWVCDLRMVRKDGTTFWVNLSATAAQDSPANSESDTDHAPVSRVVLSDITERKLAEKALKRSENLLRATQQLTHVGSWEWDVQTQTTFWTEETYRIHDLGPGEAVPGPELLLQSLKCYRPEDLPVIRAAFQRCLEKGEPYDLEFPFTTAKGRQLRIRMLAEPVMEDGKVVRVVGFIMDITGLQSRDRASDALSAAEK